MANQKSEDTIKELYKIVDEAWERLIDFTTINNIPWEETYHAALNRFHTLRGESYINSTVEYNNRTKPVLRKAD